MNVVIFKERSFAYKSNDEVFAHFGSTQLPDDEKVNKTSIDNDGHIHMYDINGDGLIDAKSYLGVASFTAS